MSESQVPILALLGVPIAAAALLAAIGGYRIAATVNVLASLATASVAWSLFVLPPVGVGPLFFIDDFNLYLVVLNASVSCTASVFSWGYVRHELAIGKLTSAQTRFYHASYQLLTAGMLLALVANNIGLMWVAVEAATLATVTMVSLYRTRASIEAAWKYFILASVGIALALFGTILAYFSAKLALPVGAEEGEAMAWTTLRAVAGQVDPYLLNLAFVFLVVGYGTKAGLVPMHAWLPDAHAEGPTPISAVLSGLLLNVALYALLRFKMVLAANGAALSPGPLMMTLGTLSVLVGGLMIYRRRDAKRLFSYSSIEHIGICTVAFGIGGPNANFGGLLHMALHSLAKSAIFFTIGHVSQCKGSQAVDDIGGMTATHPAAGWTLLLGILAIAGLPPLGLFMSEFLIISSGFDLAPYVIVPLVVGLLIALGGLATQAQKLCFGHPTAATAERPPQHSWHALLPALLHLGLVLVAGIWLPEPLVKWFRAVAALLG